MTILPLSPRRSHYLTTPLVLLATACGASDFPGDAPAGSAEFGAGEPVASEALASTVNPNNYWLSYGARYTATTAFSGQLGTFFADVTGDGKADAIAVNSDKIYVRKANASGTFDAAVAWTNVPFWGAIGTFFADVTGDGKADAIADDAGGVVVWRSTGTSFNPVSEHWSSTGISGTHGVYFADVTGDGKADAVVANDDKVYVRRANASAFDAAVAWTNVPFWGAIGTYFADVTGDGKADAIAVDPGGVVAWRSTGLQFAATSDTWTPAGGSHGSVGTYVADVSGDGLADLVAVNTDGTWVARSNRFHFGVMELVADQPILGTPYFADVNGDGRADQVELVSSGLRLSMSRTRNVNVRFVQFRPTDTDNSRIVSDATLQATIDGANQVYAAAGIALVKAGSHVVTSARLSGINIGSEAAIPVATLRQAVPYNSTCDVTNVPSGYVASLDLHMDEMWQLNWAATRCAKPGEIVVYVNDLWDSNDPNYYPPNTGFIPAYGKTAFLHPEAMSHDDWRFAHEMGHVLSLDHPWANWSNDPQTGQWTNGLFWDLAYLPSLPGQPLTFRNRQDSMAMANYIFPTALNGATGNKGWWCPDPSVTCPVGAPSGTFMLKDPTGSSRQFSTDDEFLAGMTMTLPDHTRTVNVMAYDQNPGTSGQNLNSRRRAFSESQIEQIHRVLTFNMKTVVTYSNGSPVWGDRQLLGR